VKPIELHIATSLPDALQFLAQHGQETAVLAGGTDLHLRIRSGRENPPRVLDISRLDELRGIGLEPAGAAVATAGANGEPTVRLGALVTHARAAASPDVLRHVPLLAEGCLTVGSPQIRNLGTVGGNCITGSRAGDSLPALMALDAELVLRSTAGERRVKMTQFFVGARTADRRRDELLTHILIPGQSPTERSGYIKFAQRKAMAISVASVAMRLEMEPGDPRRCRRAAVALGNLHQSVIRARGVEAALIGQVIDEATIDRAAGAAAGEVAPRDDVRASAEYRLAMVRALVRQAIERLTAPEAAYTGVSAR
jgi:carbon-monoxide dehydrogenase medium subunit